LQQFPDLGQTGFGRLLERGDWAGAPARTVELRPVAEALATLEGSGGRSPAEWVEELAAAWGRPGTQPRAETTLPPPGS